MSFYPIKIKTYASIFPNPKKEARRTKNFKEIGLFWCPGRTEKLQGKQGEQKN